MNPINPVISGLMAAMQVANTIRQQSMAQEELQIRKQREDRMARLDEQRLRDSDLQTRMGLNAGGAKPLDAEGRYGQQVRLPDQDIAGVTVRGGSTGSTIPADPGQTVAHGGQQFFLPTRDQLAGEDFQRQIMQAREMQGVQNAGNLDFQRQMTQVLIDRAAQETPVLIDRAAQELNLPVGQYDGQTITKGNAPLVQTRIRQQFDAEQKDKDRQTRVKIAADAEHGRDRRAASRNAVQKQLLTEAGLDLAARQYAATGQIPSLGTGSKAERTQVINRAAQLYPNLDLASNRAEYDANRTSLGSLQKSRDAVGAFEQTALKNLKLFTDQAKRIMDTGSPWVNKPLRTITRNAVGDADFLAYEAARRVAVNEISRVTSNPNLTGVLSDSARKEVESFIPENATLKEVYKVAEMLKADMHNRRESLDEQIAGIKARIGSGNNNQPRRQDGGSRPPLSSFER